MPQGTPQARGKALVNLLPLDEGETITTLMPLPEDEESWNELDVMFATASGGIRRNRLSDFTNVMANGKIAMKLNEGDQLIGVQACNENQDVLLATAAGKCIRFPTTEVRVFAGRNSTGVRGIRLADGDSVISMSILRHVEFSVEERDAYLRRRRHERMDSENGDANGNGSVENGESVEAVELDDDRYAQMSEVDEYILTLAANGYGKRSSAYEYAVRKRGGQGIANIDLGSGKENSVTASFPVDTGDQLVLVTDHGQMIRTTVDDIRIAGRSTRGVIVFRVADDEKVVSVSRLSEEEDDAEGDDEAIETFADDDTAPDAEGGPEGSEEHNDG